MSTAEMAALYERGFSLRQIGWRAHYSHVEVRRRLILAGVVMRPASFHHRRRVAA